MLYYDRIDAFEDIDVNKTSGSKKCIIFQYCYSYKSFRFQSSVCKSFYDVLMMSFEYFKCLSVGYRYLITGVKIQYNRFCYI